MPLAAFVFLVLDGHLGALGRNAASFSPDHSYLAATVHGEADSSYLCVFHVSGQLSDREVAKLRKKSAANALDPSLRKPRSMFLQVMDVDSFLWIPGRPHTLIYGESGIYGEGEIRLTDFVRRPKSVASLKGDEVQVFIRSYEPRLHLLIYDIRSEAHNRWKTKRHSTTIRF